MTFFSLVKTEVSFLGFFLPRSVFFPFLILVALPSKQFKIVKYPARVVVVFPGVSLNLGLRSWAKLELSTPNFSLPQKGTAITAIVQPPQVSRIAVWTANLKFYWNSLRMVYS